MAKKEKNNARIKGVVKEGGTKNSQSKDRIYVGENIEALNVIKKTMTSDSPPQKPKKGK